MATLKRTLESAHHWLYAIGIVLGGTAIWGPTLVWNIAGAIAAPACFYGAWRIQKHFEKTDPEAARDMAFSDRGPREPDGGA